MQKDVIYIDVEDDITAIIGKVKDAKHHIVALVPPKRLGALQSAVNLKLVHRAAEQADKRLVIISSNAALMALAGSAGIPVAKSLQSKPELAEVPALEVDDGEDVIDGTASDTADASAATDKPSDDEPEPKKADRQTTATLGAVAVKAKDKVKVPNFDSFRKKLFLGVAGLALLVGFLVWAIVVAPRATIVVTARTTDVALNSGVTLGPSLATDLKAGTIKSELKTSKKDVSIPITATGQKDAGTKATGQVKFSTSQISALGTVIPAGTVLSTASGATYTTDASVTITLSNYTGAPVSITATENGAKYNGATGSLTGAPSGISTTVSQSTSGGTDKMITVVQQSDVDKVSADIVGSGEADAAKAAIKKQFGDDYIVLDNTFKTDTTAVKPSPAVGAEAADGKATLAGSVSFSITAVQKTEVAKYLDAYFARQIDGKTDQKVYSNGLGEVSFTNISAKDGGTLSANISTNGKIGPKIDEAALKEYAKGKNLGEIQAYVQDIKGVDTVDIKFSPFWVSAAPNDASKITVEFKVNGQ